jgi:hypothetical protein
MGADIHSFVESQDDKGVWRVVPWPHGEWPDEGPFGVRNYGVFGWLADVRNYSAVPVIAPLRGLPEDVTSGVRADRDRMDGDAHSASWLSVDELLAFDYDAEFEDRRVTIGNNAGATAEPGGGKVTTFREFLGGSVMPDLDRLRQLNEQRPTRVVFWFDN